MSWRGFAMSVLAFVFTMLFSATLLVLGPGDFAGRALLTILLCPLIWTGVMFYCYWDHIAWRPAAALATGILLCGLMVMFFEVNI